MIDFEGKNVLISGGSSGIGFCLAEKFTALGANVCLLARREGFLKKAQASLLRKSSELFLEEFKKTKSQDISIISADVGDYHNLKKALSNKLDKVDVLINSAGIAYPGEFVNLDPKIFANVIQVNYLGTVYLAKLVVPGMIERKSGYIVNIASLASLIGIYGYTAYAPSKYAVRGFSRCLRSELKPFGIDVSVVLPPDTDTPQLEFELSIIPEITHKINQSGEIMSPEKVADCIINGIKHRKFTIIPGFEGKLLYLFAPIFGRYFYHFAVQQAKKSMDK